MTCYENRENQESKGNQICCDAHIPYPSKRPFSSNRHDSFFRMGQVEETDLPQPSARDQSSSGFMERQSFGYRLRHRYTVPSTRACCASRCCVLLKIRVCGRRQREKLESPPAASSNSNPNLRCSGVILPVTDAVRVTSNGRITRTRHDTSITAALRNTTFNPISYFSIMAM